MEISVAQSVSHCEILHSYVIEGAHGINISSLRKVFKLLLGLVEIEHCFHAVEMLTDVVLVFENS